MKKKIVVFFMVVLLAGTMVACNRAGNPENVAPRQISEVVEYGNGVYYFPYTAADLGNSLSQFLANHTDLKVDAVAGNGTGLYGHEVGYFVIVSKK